jgi:hypothetical protein
MLMYQVFLLSLLLLLLFNRNFSLLSFGDEAEEDDEGVTDVNKGHKMKSSHDVLSDPKLINQPAVTSEDLRSV